MEIPDLDDRVHGLPGPQPGRGIPAVMRRARAVFVGEGGLQVTVGADSEAGREVTDSFEARFPVPDRSDGR